MATRLRAKSNDLTRAELEVMLIIWQKAQCVIHDIREELPLPKPAYNTVSTIVRILEKKGFVAHKTYGKTYLYYPTVAKLDYTKRVASAMLRNFFDGSTEKLISFFNEEEGQALTAGN